MRTRKDLPAFDPAVYVKITLTDLTVFAIHVLHSQGLDLDAEEIISACFLMFPKRFSLRKYPHWPDSAVVGRRWGDLREKGYLVGTTATGFKLTAKGFRHAAKVGKMLGGGTSPKSRVNVEVRTKAGRYVRAVETSEAFVHFKKKGRKAKINEFDFRSMLLCTMESSPATLARNLEQFKEYVQLYERKDLFAFLEYCEVKFSYLLVEERKPPAVKTHREEMKNAKRN
jgi:hypothetical protein